MDGCATKPIIIIKLPLNSVVGHKMVLDLGSSKWLIASRNRRNDGWPREERNYPGLVKIISTLEEDKRPTRNDIASKMISCWPQENSLKIFNAYTAFESWR